MAKEIEKKVHVIGKIPVGISIRKFLIDKPYLGKFLGYEKTESKDKKKKIRNSIILKFNPLENDMVVNRVDKFWSNTILNTSVLGDDSKGIKPSMENGKFYEIWNHGKEKGKNYFNIEINLLQVE